MKKEIKLIALDLDGTVVHFNDDIITNNTIEAVRQAQSKGIEVVIATGRSRSTSLHIAEQLGVHYLINLNGGEIWTRPGELLKSQPLDHVTAQKIIEIQKKYQSFSWFVTHEQIYLNELPPNYLDQEWLKMGFDVADDRDREEMKEQFAQMDTVELTNSSLTNMELNPKGVHKANALLFLIDKLGIQFNQVMTIGDSLNDLKMIEAAGIGVAMGNAQDIVKEHADWITTSNEEDGVAVAIQRLLN